MTSWKPSPLLIRILSAFVILGGVIGLVFAGIFGVYVLVLILGGLALWEFDGLSEGMGSRAPAWLLFPLGAFFAFSGTLLKAVDVNLVLALSLVGGLAAFLVVPGRRQGLSRWAMAVAGAWGSERPGRLSLVRADPRVLPCGGLPRCLDAPTRQRGRARGDRVSRPPGGRRERPQPRPLQAVWPHGGHALDQPPGGIRRP